MLIKCEMVVVEAKRPYHYYFMQRFKLIYSCGQVLRYSEENIFVVLNPPKDI